MNFSGEHSAQLLRYGQAPRGCRSGASGWPSAPSIGHLRKAVCPVDRARLDGRLPPPIRRLRMVACLPIERPRMVACSPIGSLRMAVCPRSDGFECYAKYREMQMGRSPPRSDGFDTHSVPMQTQKGDPVGSPFNSGTDQKNQLKVIVDDPYLYRSSFSFAAS